MQSRNDNPFSNKLPFGLNGRAVAVASAMAVALALGWALGGLMGWGQEVTYGLIGLSLAGGAYLTAIFVRNAMKAEPFYE